MMMLAAHRRFGAEAKQKQRVTFRSNCFATNISNTNGLHALPGTPLGIHPFSGAHMDLARTTARAQKEERRILQAYGYGFTAEGTALVERCFNQLPAYIKETLRRQPRSHSLSESLWLVLKELDADSLPWLCSPRLCIAYGYVIRRNARLRSSRSCPLASRSV